MANRYWVAGGTGNWDSTTNWSATSGGASGASVPISTDDVFINALSGTSPVINVNNIADCLSLDFTGAITPTLAGSNILSIYGSLTFISSLTRTFTGAIFLKSTTAGRTITMSGITLAANILFSGGGGSWTLQDDVNTTATFNLTSGTLNTNGKTINCSTVNSSGTAVRTLNLGSSIINTKIIDFTTSTNFTFNAGTSKIVYAPTDDRTFQGGGNTFYEVVFASTFGNKIAGSNTFNKLTLSTGKTLKLAAGTTQTITSLVSNGTLATSNILQSDTAGVAAIIALPVGRYFIRHNTVQDITITGATSVTNIGGINTSNNTGITFVTKFEIGRIKNDGSFNWYNTATGLVTKVSG